MLFEGTGNNPGDKTLEDKFFEHEVSVQRFDCGIVGIRRSKFLFSGKVTVTGRGRVTVFKSLVVGKFQDY